MFRVIRTYSWGAMRRAWHGSLNSALNWSGITGAGLLGAGLEYRGSQMTFGEGWHGVVLSGIAYTAVAWAAIFVVRLIFIAPFQMWREQKNRADALEGLRDVASQVSRPPSFDLGFEFSQFDPTLNPYSDEDHKVCRIWVENVEHVPLSECRVMIESLLPNSPMPIGALLLPDERGEHAGEPVFHLAPTQKKFFKLLEMHESFDSRVRHSGEKEWELMIRSDQEPMGWMSSFHRKHLSYGERYFATLAVHGKNAVSRRINLTIDVKSATDIIVIETSQRVQNGNLQNQATL